MTGRPIEAFPPAFCLNIIKKVGELFDNSKNFCIFARINIKDMTMAQDNFKRYDSPEQYAEAFQQMIDARERWREQVREQEAKSAR